MLEQRQIRQASTMKYNIEDFTWRVRVVPNWLGGKEVMIEIAELLHCVSFGETFKEAKEALTESLFVWIQKNGEHRLPKKHNGAHIIYLDVPMSKSEFTYINAELKKLDS